MLFNAPSFLFAFLPAALVGTFLLQRYAGRRASIAFLVLASLLFYDLGQPRRLLLILLGSVLFNFLIGRAITARRTGWLVCLGVGIDLAFLGWFKYAGFISVNLAALDLPVAIRHVTLPIGISFFTFTQIAYLIDAYRGQAHRYRLLDYTLFVSFFPHLVAGPILQHRSIVPQFTGKTAFRASLDNLELGLSWFIAGLFKKAVLADALATPVDAVFGAAAGTPISGADAWFGALGYALQLYFDFSGYSDMAIGLALMLGITFPLNFASPYKAVSLIDFWRRWHITLSHFLRDYLYIPLGGSRRGEWRRMTNLFITMLLGGLWHGAGWTFVLWGALHGAGLVVNHLWRRLARPMPLIAGQALTLLFVVLAWVPFRADTLATTLTLWRSMLQPTSGVTASSAWTPAWIWIATLSAIALLLPNTAQLFGREPGAGLLRWRPTASVAMVVGGCLAVSLVRLVGEPSAFLYFRF